MPVTGRTAPPPPRTTAPSAPSRDTIAQVIRVLAAVLCVIVTIGVAGATVETVVARGDDERYPATGRLVDTSYGPLHLHCTGRGSPTVLLVGGLGEPGLTFVDIQQRLDRSVTVCSYDRAGYGWSPSNGEDWTAQAAAAQVAEALGATEYEGPYVVVAHSLGSLVARELRQADPGALVGMVLLDPTNEVTLDRLGTPAPALLERTAMGVLARTGVVRLVGDQLIPSLTGSRPPHELLDRAPATYHSRAVAASVRELQGAPGAARHLLLNEDSDWADLPLSVVSAATTTPQDREHHRALAARSIRGHHLVSDHAGHYVHYDDPDLVVQALCDVLAERAALATC